MSKTKQILTLGNLIDIEIARKACTDDGDKIMSDAAIVNGISLKELKDLPIGKAKALIQSSEWIYPILNCQEVSNTITVDKTTYTIKEVKHLPFGQFTNLEAVLKANSETPYQALPKILGILLNEEKEEQMYEGMFTHIQKASLSWDAKEVIPLINFTLTQGIESLQSTLPYLEHQRREMTLEIMTKLINLEIALTVSLKGSGFITGGMRRFVTWPAILLIRLMQSLIVRQAKSFIS